MKKIISRQLAIALLIAVPICILTWYKIESLLLKILITILCIFFVWMIKEMKDSPVLDENYMLDEEQYGREEQDIDWSKIRP